MLRDQPFMRDDTFLGVCQALGEGFRIPPTLLRIAIAPAVVWQPVMSMAVYAVAGVIIALLYWIVPGAPAAAAPIGQRDDVKSANRAMDQEEFEVAQAA